MATIEQLAIGEVDVVAFERPIKKVDGVGSWPTGTIGAVVSDYGDVKESRSSATRAKPWIWSPFRLSSSS